MIAGIPSSLKEIYFGKKPSKIQFTLLSVSGSGYFSFKKWENEKGRHSGCYCRRKLRENNERLNENRFFYCLCFLNSCVSFFTVILVAVFLVFFKSIFAPLCYFTVTVCATISSPASCMTNKNYSQDGTFFIFLLQTTNVEIFFIFCARVFSVVV